MPKTSKKVKKAKEPTVPCRYCGGTCSTKDAETPCDDFTGDVDGLYATNTINLHNYDAVEISNSGGKDSVAMLVKMIELADEQDYPRNQIHVVHADLGRVEWEGTLELAREQAEFYGLDFRTVARPQGDLLSQIENERGIFPTPTRRFCTSDHKTAQIHRVLTQIANEIRATNPDQYRRSWNDPRPGVRPVKILSCVGFRAEESPARKALPSFHVDEDATGKGTKKHIDIWYPIQDWKLDRVWDTIKTTGIPYHYAYDLGMPRLSCVFCIFAPKDALLIAGKHNPNLLAEYVRIEKKIDFTFKKGLPLAKIQEELNAGIDLPEGVALEDNGCWNM